MDERSHLLGDINVEESNLRDNIENVRENRESASPNSTYDNYNSVPMSSSVSPLDDSIETVIATELQYTYWFMKKRQWSRLQRGTFTNEKRGFSILWFAFFLAAYGAYLFLQIYHFQRTDRNCFRAPTTCIYEGPLVDGRPHGIGTWMDTSYQGELLSGYWEDGIPIGPFESMENDTRSLLVNLRIVYGTNGGGKSWLDRVPLHTGVAAVECCVSGNFFKGYPKVSMIKGPDLCSCKKCSCIKKLFENRSYKHSDDDKTLTSIVVSVDRKMDTLLVSGHKSKLLKQGKVEIELISKDKKSLVLDNNWISSQTSEVFAQFLALGHFPNHIKPFVFNWPSSTSSLLYWCAHSIASDNDNHRDLQKFIESLGNAGIRNLHIMCHSMGTRFLLRSFSKVKKAFGKRMVLSPNVSFNNIPNVPEQQQRQHESKISLTNLIFLNPDYEIETFKNDYDELRNYCPRITVYADHRDMAIKMAFKMLQKQNLGNNINPISDDYGRSLDVDIIDTGDLDSNMSERHHSFFNINRLMVDDLHDLIVTGKRAEERTSRLKKVNDVYRFSILPSSVVVV
ncbi:hypothetical protein PPL_08391 [Heterostelium album PN500]|uniref:Uncharacterized protein n=1 Tax=Heterostelium pallidum (strain ATCC 26659 / Pp 5 / PN500) TaxID=670386 RepID=D3BI23_HETP5|nr:hypothetical protein PPL_08391 [Heterostelium album PN500]EFA78923.1 hypothetical protein PPL_08391 [Heterostelium album PN500]|eukprot:XP_020431047.1 hypothetical protein PPL_08391 [Heterostelium album PN500]